MTTVIVLADPPDPDVVLQELVAATPIAPGEAATLYRAMLKDVAIAVQESGGDLLVNYRPAEAIQADTGSVEDVEDTIRSHLGSEVSDARYEPQVGETLAGRIGNSVTHLLEQEEAQTAAVVKPTAALLTRTEIDSAAMKLRRSSVVLGPAPAGRVYYAGFAEPIDFTAAYDPPAVRTLTERAVDADLDVDYLPMMSVLETAPDLATILALVEARQRAGRPVPRHTSDTLADLDLGVEDQAGSLTAVRSIDRP